MNWRSFVEKGQKFRNCKYFKGVCFYSIKAQIFLPTQNKGSHGWCNEFRTSTHEKTEYHKTISSTNKRIFETTSSYNNTRLTVSKSVA